MGKSGIKVEAYVTYMDAKLISPAQQSFSRLKELIREGYKGVPFDAVITSDNDALAFMRKYRDELFPGVPVVFCGINDFDERMLDGRRDLTGTIESTDYTGTIRIALKLRPATKNIVVVTDKTTTGQAHRSAIEKIRPDFSQSIDFAYLSLADTTLDELAQKLSKLNNDSIVLLLHHGVDRKGISHTIQESASLLAKRSSVPVFVVNDSRMGFGVLGGLLVSGYPQGETAGEMVVKILSGTDVRSIPTVLDSPNKYMFDYTVMQRFNIAERDLPQGSIVINKPVPILDEYRPYLFAVMGAFIALCGFAVFLLFEIRKRKRSEEELREVSSRLDIIIEHLPDATFVIDADRKVVAWNRAIEEMTGVPKEDMIGKGNYEYAIPFYGERRPIIIDLAFLTDEEFEKREYDAVHRSGDTLYGEVYVPRTYGGKGAYLSATASRLRDTGGNVTGAIECIRDISERKQAEETLQANEARLMAVFDSVQDFIFIKDANRRYLVINNFFQKRFQVDPSVFLGHTDAEIPIFENKDMTGAIVQDTDAMVLRGETAHFELMHRVCGTLLTLDILKTPIRDRQGNVTGICGVSRDITERRKVEEEKRGLEERLNRAEKMESLGTLAGGVAHDLNNVLGIVVGYAEMLMDEMDESNPMRNDLMKIMEGGNRSAAIVQDLLTLARRGVQTKKTVNLNATITDCQKLPEFEKIFSYSRQVKLQTDLESDLLNIIGSPVHLGKTIINLASNAVEAMPNGGVLKIATSNQYLDMPIHGYDNIREGDYVVLTVSDTGEGILERDIKRIFEPFYTKKIMGRSGTGLGLAVVWGTVKDHNGYINVESTEGEGTTFTLYFPVTRDEIAGDLISVSMSEYLGGGETILVVDDINRQRELASRMLTKLNYSVSTVASGEEAIEYLKTNKADLIVLDMIMDPGIDGLDTYEKILEINPAQRAVIVSGFSESDRVKEAQKIGAGAYVPKPYVLERLGMAVRKELDRK